MTALDQYVSDFLRDATYRVGELTGRITDLADEGNYRYQELYNKRKALWTFMKVVFDNYSSFYDGAYNFLGIDQDEEFPKWTEREIISEIDYLRSFSGMASIPYVNFTGYYPEILNNTVINGINISDPNANVLLGWDDIDGTIVPITIGSNLSYDHPTHTLSSTAAGGGLPGITSDGTAQFYGDTTKTRWYERPMAEHTGATSGASSILASGEIANGDSITIEILYAIKEDGSGTGGGGLYTANWVKEGGVLTKCWEDDTKKGNNMGATMNLSTANSGGSIVATLTRVTGGNISWSWIARIIHRKF